MITRHLPITKLSPDDQAHYWVGYYDKQPFSADNSRLLTHRTTFLDHLPTPGEPCQIGTITNGQFTHAATTNAWNWQQGAHLRWSTLPGQESLLFNDLNDNAQPIARWVTPQGKQLHSINSPIYAVTPDGQTNEKIGLTLDFGRLTRLREEYGYPALADKHPTNPAPKEEGLWKVDLQTGERTLLVSIHQLAAINTNSFDPGDIDLTTPSAPHQHINHIMINPEGTRCCFLHRYDRDDGILQSRLFTIGLDGSAPQTPRLLIEGMISHYDWLDDHAILAWGGKRKLLGSGTQTKSPKAKVMTLARRTLKPIYYAMGKPRFLMNKIMGDSYLIIPDQDDPTTTPFAKGKLTCDGHNTFFRGNQHIEPNQWMVTDGYPDMKSKQPLYLWDIKQNQGYEIGRYHTPKHLDGPVRIDLHPRFSRDAKSICIDSAMNKSRAIYQIDISQLTNPEATP
ncbi:MAG: hypothetical protein JKY43_02585 [Phycisphaerales bacterium]|nr:hypothetical protein [Phycisphaerales bacterium]